MSTRSYIILSLQDNDKNKELKCDSGKIINTDNNEYIGVYCHHDGYPDGVGKYLINTFVNGDYEYALNYILEGGRTSATESYWGEHLKYKNKYEDIPPFTANNIDDLIKKTAFDIEYVYIMNEKDGVIDSISMYDNKVTFNPENIQDYTCKYIPLDYKETGE